MNFATMSQFIAILALAASGAYAAQPADPVALAPEEQAPQTDAEAEATPAPAPEGETGAEPDADNMADLLNAQQDIRQTFTLKRSINGEIVESEKRTVVYDRTQPVRPTEAGQTTVEKLRSEFDSELLTRKEAFEEAKIDFIIADINRDERMSADEFASLVASWRESAERSAPAPSEDIARQREIDAFLAEISGDDAGLKTQNYAREKFSFMSGAAETITREDYIREYLLDFDAMDENKDTLLNGEELMRFRALIRGEEIGM